LKYPKELTILSLLFFVIFPILFVASQIQSQDKESGQARPIDIVAFYDSAHHWKDITDHEQVIERLPDQKSYKPEDVKEIADNILLYQQKNGGWPKNYDMLAILTDEQKKILSEGKDSLNTTFDNGTTYAQVEYLAKAYLEIKDNNYKEACMRGIDFILKAQYPNGGWPQFYPDTSEYRKYITFNDGAMIGIMNVLHHIMQNKPYYFFVDNACREKVKKAFDRGIACILKCQIIEQGVPTVWCQQNDNIDFSPRGARTFELASKCGDESAGIVLFLMSIEKPSSQIISAVKNAVSWFSKSKIYGIKVETFAAPKVTYKYRTTVTDRIVVADPHAAPIWARFYKLGSNTPFLSDRNGIPVDSLSQVGRERRDGYRWYTYSPQEVLDKYPSWLMKVENKKSMQN
jgi:PelA/Pel-15E family pectate lyase